jgi:hypothetical protein
MPKQKRALGRPKKNWMEGIRKVMNERNLNEGQLQDRKQWSLGVGQRRRTFWIRYTGCPRRNVPDFERVFLMLKYSDITQNTYVQSWTVTKIMSTEVWNLDSCYTLVDYQIHIKTGTNMWCKKTRTHIIIVLRVPSTIHYTWMARTDVTWLTAESGISLLHNCTKIQWLSGIGHHTQGQTSIRLVSWQVQCVDPPEDHTFLWPLSP